MTTHPKIPRGRQSNTKSHPSRTTLQVSKHLDLFAQRNTLIARRKRVKDEIDTLLSGYTETNRPKLEELSNELADLDRQLSE